MTKIHGVGLILSLLAASALGYGCSSSDSSSPEPAGSDSGTQSDSSTGDGGTSDSSTSDASTGDSSTDDASAGDSSTDDASTGDSSTDADSSDSSEPTDGGQTDGDVGPQTLDFDPNGTGSPDAIHWDDAKQTLYIVDDRDNQVWTYQDGVGFQKLATVPDDPALTDAGRTKLNGITELADGTLVITRFGYGTGGAIYTLSPDGGTTTVPNVPANRKRIAVKVDPSTGVVYGDSFTGGGGTPPAGWIETVDLANGTTAYATGFGKTVGLLVQGNSILVSDQTNDVIVSVPLNPAELADGGATLADGGAFPVYATLAGPDQLSAGPNGTVYTGEFLPQTDGGGAPQVRQILPDGGVVVPWPDITFTSINDVAYDPTNHRLFVVDSNGTTVRMIHILPVSP